MDFFFLYQGQRFVWDGEKARTNADKHGVSFEQACEVFFDPFLRVEDAATGSEQREAAIGVTEDRSMLYVVHLLREDDTIRIISARPATPAERKFYEEDI